MNGLRLQSRSELFKIIDTKLPVAEIGAAEGLYSRNILSWGVSKLYLVDNWGTLPQTGDGGYEQAWHDKNFENVKKINDPRLEILRGISWEMAAKVPDESLGLAYIDCCHTYECVKKDLEAWFPKVVCGGIVAGHDFDNPDYGVKEAVMEFAKGRFEVIAIPEEHWSNSSFYFVKTC